MSATRHPPSCIPTWHGHVETTKDALIIFQACFDGLLQHCSRRPHDRERAELIKSGNVFVYEEQTSGIKRWTDGIPWSPSRILTNFLIYRQLNSPFPPGEKKRATKRNARTSKGGDGFSTPPSATSTPIEPQQSFAPPTPTASDSPSVRRDPEMSDQDSTNRGLVGSLVDSYEFKEGGLLKKTMTVTVRNVNHHLVSYYSLEDAKGALKTPREDPRFKDTVISEGLMKQPKFKFPNYDDAGDGTFETADAPYAYPNYQPHQQGYGSYPYPYTSNPYNHPGYQTSSQQYPGYSLPPSNTMYGPASSQHHHPQYHAQSYPSYPPPHVQQQQQQQYHSSYPQQQYAGHHQPQIPGGQNMTPVKQEPGTTSAPQSYNGTPAHSQPALGQGYPHYQSNGTPAAAASHEDGSAGTGSSHAPQAPHPHAWAAHGYGQAWPAGVQPRPDAQGYAPPYRQPG